MAYHVLVFVPLQAVVLYDMFVFTFKRFLQHFSFPYYIMNPE